ncbi:MAG: hypothetical protein MR550_01105 [Bacilli bacterium]|nr:hypothetical protein [Bacilli bacterium]
MKEKVIEITNKLNTLIDASNYSVPLLDNFEIIKKDIKSNVIFLAKYNNSTEMFLSDGTLKENEDLNKRIVSVINNTNNYLKNNNCESYQVYYRDYNINNFNFKLVLQDMYAYKNNELVAIKSINAYFVSKNKEVYLITLSSGPYSLKESEQLNKIKNINDDIVYSSL